MKRIIITAIIMLSAFIVKAQKVDSIKIYLDSNGAEEIRILTNSNVPYTGKWNKIEVSREIDSFLDKQGHFAMANDSLYDFLQVINKEILLQDKKK
jgi:hypothetical protein